MKPLTKLGGVLVGLFAANEVGKVADSLNNERLARTVGDNYGKVVDLTEKPADPNSKEFKEVWKANTEICTRPTKPPLNGSEKRMPSGHVVDSVKQTVLKGRVRKKIENYI